MKIALLNDLHFGQSQDIKIFHAVQRRFFEDVFFPRVDAEGIKHCIILGDVFDRRKFVNFETLKVARECLFDPLSERGIETHIILGNHDVYYKNTNRVNSLSLLVSDFYPRFHLYEEAAEAMVADHPFLMLPWINPENLHSSIEILRNTNVPYVASHLELSGFEYHRGVMSDHSQIDRDLLSRFQSVLSGHYHHKSSRGNVHYLGTQYEMTWADYNDPKGFHIFENGELEFVQNPETLFHRIVYKDTKPKLIESSLDKMGEMFKDKFVKVVIKRKDHPVLFERFLDAILAQQPYKVNVVDETNYLAPEGDDPLESPQNTLEAIQTFLDGLETSLDKERVMRMIHNLYQQAKETAEDE